jgi:calcium-translocating P-type ATPase
MSLAVVEEPRLVHALPGRMRAHVPAWTGRGQRAIEARLRQAPGVRSVQANPLTSNVLIGFDATVTDAQTLLGVVRTLEADPVGAGADEPPLPPVRQEHHGNISRARIAVRGLDRDPSLARLVVERLERRPGVRATSSTLTGRVLVEWAPDAVALDDLRADVADLELANVPGEERPTDPLDPGPLVRSATRAVGAGIGLGLLAVRRGLGFAGPPVSGAGPAEVAGVIGLLESFPATRNATRAVLGANAADLLFNLAGIASLTLAGSPIGLALSAAAAVRLLTEALPRRSVWRRYEERLANAVSAQPGAVVRLEAGERTPLAARVLEGTGTANGDDGLPVPIAPGAEVVAGAALYGGPFVLELQGNEPFVPQPRPVPLPEPINDRYLHALGPFSLAYAGVTALLTRSLTRSFAALLLVNPRPALIGAEAANAGASARVLRSGVTVVGTRPNRAVRLPGVLLLDRPSTLTDGFEVAKALPLTETFDSAAILMRAASVAAAAGSPWGSIFPLAGGVPATGGIFDGMIATASVDDVRYTLGPIEDWDWRSAREPLDTGHSLLLLRREHDAQPLGALALRPRLAAGAADLVQACRRHGVEIGLLPGGDPGAARAVAERAGVSLLAGEEALDVIRARQAAGAHVAYVANNARAAAPFAACDLAIGITGGRDHFPASADLLAPDLTAVAAIVVAGGRRSASVRDSVALSLLANAAGAVWGFRGRPGVAQAAYPVNIAALGAIGVGWVRLHGGEQPRSSVSRLVDPRPERWGRRSVEHVLQAFDTSEAGLTTPEALARRQATPPPAQRYGLWSALLDQIYSPLTGILAAGAGLSLVLGSAADTAMIGAMIVANAVAGAWQEHRADQAAAALQRMGSANARVLRDGLPVALPATDVVPGDVLLLAPGDRLAADVRLFSANGLEVDEAALTGESLPVSKAPAGDTDASRVVLEGSDVIVGTGRGVVVAVGGETRLGAIRAALALDAAPPSPLSGRLSRLLGQVLPVIVAGGAIVTTSGVLRGQPVLAQLALGASIAIAAVPEGLPILAKVGEAAVARRLAGRNALVHRLSAVEALGRVDVACTDKTGTLTEGRLALSRVAGVDQETSLPGILPPDLRYVLLTAALAGPHPDAPDAAADRTDVAVAQAAEDAGLGDDLRAERSAQSPFDSARSFHAGVVAGRLCVEGAAEVLVPRCTRVRHDGAEGPLDEASRQSLLARGRNLAERGLRVLMVAEGASDTPVDDPCGLTALGFLGISDPIRPAVPAAVRRCYDAGVRVIMLTGDHPATARAIAREAGLAGDGYDVLTGVELAELPDDELDQRLERTAVIARATPLDKLRIVESLQRRGHIVAMTGDGVNDAPALRLADVGVAMGRSGTQVAREAADVVLSDDDFSTLVETLVEGRSFWRNIRRSLGLLLGGNLGELGLQVGVSVLGLASPLTSRQILAVNLITDVLPALAVALQQPEHHNLAALAREGAAAFDRPLRRDILRRALATAAPALGAYLITLRSARVPVARTAAFASIVATQLAQTLDVGWAEGGLSHSVLGAVAGSAAMLLATLAVPQARGFLGLTMLPPLGWALVGGGALVAVLLGRMLAPSRFATSRTHPAGDSESMLPCRVSQL